MCIYCGTTKYRKIYENHNGPIPKDSDGRSYEIHHLDGDKKNNSPDNLICLSIKEHYDIHYSQGDWGACFKMATRMKFSPKEISEIASLSLSQRVKNGTHNFLGGEIGGAASRKRVADGTHNFLGGEIASSSNKLRVETGTHHFLDNSWQTEKAKKQLELGTHPSQYHWQCDVCGMKGKGRSQFSRHKNGKNCQNN